MKLVMFDGGKLGVLEAGRVFDASPLFSGERLHFPLTQMHLAIQRWDEIRPRLQALVQSGSNAVPLSSVRLEAPMRSPSKLIGAFSNYRRHTQEMRGPDGRQEAPDILLKAPSSIVGPTDSIVLPVTDRKIHHEPELALVIARQCRNLATDEALGVVFGWTTLLDITVRGDGDRSRRKSYDTFAPMGPVLVTADEIADPQHLGIRLWVNGQLRQEANTADMTFGIAQVIAYASSVMTLMPGDVIATGTPEGVAPIVAGDTITIEIEQVGRMDIPVTAGTAAA